MASQRDAIREQLLLAQRRCEALAAENSQVHGVNDSLNGMLAILGRADLEMSAHAAATAAAAERDAIATSENEREREAARAAREREEEESEERLAEILLSVYGPQYAALRRDEAAFAPELDHEESRESYDENEIVE